MFLIGGNELNKEFSDVGCEFVVIEFWWWVILLNYLLFDEDVEFVVGLIDEDIVLKV